MPGKITVERKVYDEARALLEVEPMTAQLAAPIENAERCKARGDIEGCAFWEAVAAFCAAVSDDPTAEIEIEEDKKTKPTVEKRWYSLDFEGIEALDPPDEDRSRKV